MAVEPSERVEETVKRARWPLLMAIGLYTVTSLIGAGLLFSVEPMVAKTLLPAYGGSPMVWNTSVLFFQATLLVGYAYAHWSQRRFGPRRQPLTHVVVVCLPVVALPVTLPAWSVAPESAPTALWLILVLTVMIGAPFAVLSTTGPLLQRWYSWSGLPRAQDPYFLYAASNVGSLAALLSYPFLIEPAAGLTTQARWWACGYLVFVVFMIACAVLVLRQVRSRGDDAVAEADEQQRADAADQIDWRRRARWLGLAFLPSSLVLGVTTHISTDIAPVPLMWVIPLALYLATFIIAFGGTRHRWLPATVRMSAVPSAALPWMLVLLAPDWGVLVLPLDLALVLIAGLACHGLLAKDRPSPQRLTEFFLYVSLGGVLGGVFNGLLAPVVFDWGAELPLVIAALALLSVAVPWGVKTARRFTFPGWRALSRTFLLTTPAAAVVLGLRAEQSWIVLIGVVALGSWAWLVVRRRPRALIAASVFTIVMLGVLLEKAVPIQERTFFGSYRVAEKDGRRLFSHGTTLHGFQILSPAQRTTPTSYYGRRGPLGDVFATHGDRPGADRVGVVGLGTGTVAAYGRAGQRMDFYEIDLAVIRIAREHFSYLRDCACEEHTIVGDGRLELEKAADGTYGIIVLDAFSSDAVPAHLLTREALRLYVRKLTPGGVLAFNISNRNLDLAPMLAATARAGGLSAVAADDHTPSDGVSVPSAWVVIARSEADLRSLPARDGRWRPVRGGGPVWTDAYSSIFDIFQLRVG